MGRTRRKDTQTGEAALQAQRDANGGLTDSEVAERERKASENVKRVQYTADNAWLIEVLQYERGDFITSMIEKLAVGPLSSLSDRCLEILRDIYAGSHGRRNSKAYNAAADLFDDKLPQEGGDR